MQSSTSTRVDSVQNKELIWSTLQESGAFAGLPGDQFQRVYAAFDRSVQEASRTMSGSLSDVNKRIIREFVQMLRTSTTQQTQPTMQNQNAPKKKKIEVVKEMVLVVKNLHLPKQFHSELKKKMLKA
jgi:hypothetical protein